MTIAVRPPLDAGTLIQASQEARAMLVKTWDRAPRRPIRERPDVITPGSMQGRRWLASEQRYLRRMASVQTAAEIAEKLGRTEYGVKVRMWFLGLSVVKRKVNEPRLIDVERAERVFAKLYPSQRQIARAISEQTGISIPELLGRSKKAPLVNARHLMIWTMARDTKLSMSQMGKRLELDHASLIHAIKREDARRGTDVRSLRSAKNRGVPQLGVAA